MAMLASIGLDPGEQSIPFTAARLASIVIEPLWRFLRRTGPPPVTRTAVAVLGQRCTVIDAKARRELGYLPVITFEDGIAAMERATARTVA